MSSGKDGQPSALQIEEGPVAKNLEADDSLFTDAYVKCFTPRSKEASKQLGVLLEELVVRPYENFKQPGVGKEITKLRYTEYEQLRQETIHMVRNHRDELISSGWQPGRGRRRLSPLAQQSSSSLFSSNDQKEDWEQHGGELGNYSKNEMLENEQARMEKVMARQNKELEAMMAYEVKMANMISKQEQRLDARLKKEQNMKAQRKEEKQKMSEKRRQWQLQKAAEEQKEKEDREARAKELFEQEQAFYEDLKKKEIERKKAAMKKQQERSEKKRILEERTQRILAEQYDLVMQKNAEMAERDLKRQKALEAKKKYLSELHAEKAREARHRVQVVIEENDERMEEQRRMLEQKMSLQELRLQQYEEEKLNERIQKQKEAEAAEKARQEKLREREAQEQQKVAAIRQKQIEHEQLKEELDQKMQEEMEFRSELGRLNRHRKRLNVERLQRKEAYRRIALIEKVNEDAARARELENQKQQILLERQRSQIAVNKQRRNLMKMFEQLKSGRNWKQLSKMTMTLTASASEASVGGDSGGKGGMSHSQSAANFS